jgi:hypothetical protein
MGGVQRLNKWDDGRFIPVSWMCPDGGQMQGRHRLSDLPQKEAV